MTGGRLLLMLLLVTAGLGGSVLFVSRAAHSLRDSPYHDQLLGQTPTPRSTTNKAQARRPQHRTSGTRRRPAARSTSRPQHTTTAKHPATAAKSDAKPAMKDGGGVFGLSGGSVLLIAGLEVAGGLLLVALLLAGLTGRRLRMRKRRQYALYELHLSSHDEAKPQDLEDMVESIANIVRAWPTERARDGQPYVAVELIAGAGESGMEWSINVRCQPKIAPALDAAISAAYPDVRLGRRHAEQPVPRHGELRTPEHVLRFRKERSFVYSLVAPDEALASPPLEQIARAQTELGEPSVVRFQLTPTPSYFEELARRLYRRHENQLVRQERWGLPEGGLWSTLNRAEMGNAQRTQNRSLFWLEIQVAADTPQACKTIAAAVQSRRGENRLHRRWMHVRQRLYRRRFPQALGPLLPSLRSLVSAGEVAHLLALPSARMKGVPVRRLALPRIPMPPEAVRAKDTATPAVPTRMPEQDAAPAAAKPAA
jgi:hypothetical protein